MNNEYLAGRTFGELYEMSLKINNTNDFINHLKGCNINNILIGNGFGLAHPILGECFKWNLHEAFCSDWQMQLPTKSLNCPESDFNVIRENITRKILQFYINRLFEKVDPADTDKLLNSLYTKYNEDGLSCKKLLMHVEELKGNIFTLNYDPLLYFEVLNYNTKNNLVDGFVKSRDGNFLSQESIIEKLNDLKNAKVYFNHGSWFILENENGELDKISFSSFTKKNISDLFIGDQKPFLILEERWITKKTLIDGSIYLRHCYDRLAQSEGSLLAFGLSFLKDDHILKALENSKYEKIHITFFDQICKENIENKISTLLSLKSRVTFIQVDKNVIWDRQTD